MPLKCRRNGAKMSRKCRNDMSFPLHFCARLQILQHTRVSQRVFQHSLYPFEKKNPVRDLPIHLSAPFAQYLEFRSRGPSGDGISGRLAGQARSRGTTIPLRWLTGKKDHCLIPTTSTVQQYSVDPSWQDFVCAICDSLIFVIFPLDFTEVMTCDS